MDMMGLFQVVFYIAAVLALALPGRGPHDGGV